MVCAGNGQIPGSGGSFTRISHVGNRNRRVLRVQTLALTLVWSLERWVWGAPFWVPAALPCHSTWEPRACGPTSVVRGFLCVETLTNMRWTNRQSIGDGRIGTCSCRHLKVSLPKIWPKLSMARVNTLPFLPQEFIWYTLGSGFRTWFDSRLPGSLFPGSYPHTQRKKKAKKT